MNKKEVLQRIKSIKDTVKKLQEEEKNLRKEITQYIDLEMSLHNPSLRQCFEWTVRSIDIIETAIEEEELTHIRSDLAKYANYIAMQSIVDPNNVAAFETWQKTIKK